MKRIKLCTTTGREEEIFHFLSTTHKEEEKEEITISEENDESSSNMTTTTRRTTTTTIIDVTKIDDLLMEILAYNDYPTLLQAKKVSHRWEDLASMALDRKATASSSAMMIRSTKGGGGKPEIFHQLAIENYQNHQNEMDAALHPIIGSFYSYTRPSRQRRQQQQQQEEQQDDSRDEIEVGVLLSYPLPSVPMAA